MPEFFAILCAIFGIIIGALGVRRSTKSRTRSDIRNSRERLDNIIHDNKRLERDKERVEELDARDADKLRECSRIGERIRKREQEADTSE